MLTSRKHTGLQSARHDGVLHLIRKLDHRVDLLLRLLPLLDELLELGVDGVLAAQERIDEVLLEGKARLDGLFARPVLAVGFALDEYLERVKPNTGVWGPDSRF
jgi:hypothetical protein